MLNPKHVIRDSLRMVFRPLGYSYLRFILTHKYIPSFKHPRSFSEKIGHRKFYVDPTLFSKFVDKYTVRDYVKSKIGEEYLIPILMVVDNVDKSYLDKLPSEFVVKTSHGGGGNNVLVVRNKNDIKFESICNDFNKFLKIQLGSKVDELFYDIEKPVVIFEKLIKNNDNSPLLDYKFHVFKNKGATKIILQINSEYNTSNCTKTLYEISGEKSKIQFENYKHAVGKFDLPENFDKMTDFAIALSDDFEYARIDLFNVNGTIYFGEITLCPASGWDKLNSKENDFLLGSYWDEFNN